MADPVLNLRLKRALTHPLFWLVAAAMALGVLRALVVPAGNYNIDEAIHLRIIQQAADALPVCFEGGNCRALIFARDLAHQGSVYYLTEALILSLLPSSAADSVRLLVARLVTLSLNVPVIWLAYLTMRELFPRQRQWALTTAGLAAFIPSFSDMMSGVNLDAPAALIGSLIVYTLARILRRGISVGCLTALIIEILAGYTLKGTTWPLFVVIVCCFWLLLPRRLRIASAAIIVLSSMAAFVVLRPLNWHGAAHWFYQRYHYSPGLVLPDRVETTSLVGQYSLEATGQIDSRGRPEIVVQYLPERIVRQLRGKSITYGAWVRAADGEAIVSAFTCATSDEKPVGELAVSSKWQFHAVNFQVPSDAEHLGCFLSLPAVGESVLYDGMVASEGTFPTDQAPEFAGPEGQTGVWAGEPFVNLLANPSAEEVWPQVEPSAGYPYLLNNRIVAVLDWQRTLPAWYDLARWLLVNFWSGFGGIQPGLSSLQMIPLALLTVLAAFGITLMVVKDLPRRTSPLTTIPARRGFWLGFASRRPSARPFTTIPARRGFWLGFASRRPSVRPFTAIPARRGFWLLLAAGFVVILLLLYRADIVAYQATMLIWSSTRHASAGRVALSAMLAMGLLRWIPWRWQRWSVATGLAVLFLINIYILLRVQYPFQHCPLPDATSCLSTIR